MSFRGYVFDLDGTVYLGDTLLPGAKRAVLRLRADGARILFLSNKPIETRDAYAAKLTRLGIPTCPEDVMNSSLATASYLSTEMPGARVFVIGEPPLQKELRDAGLRAATEPEQTDLVLISLDRGLTYEKLHFAYRAAKLGARVMATNPDLVCPMPDDEIIDAGAIIAAMEALLGRPIDGVVGKPSPIIARAMLDLLALPPETCLIVGDRIETDIALGKEAGTATALVLTGVTDRATLERSAIQPDYVLENLDGILEIG